MSNLAFDGIVVVKCLVARKTIFGFAGQWFLNGHLNKTIVPHRACKKHRDPNPAMPSAVPVKQQLNTKLALLQVGLYILHSNRNGYSHLQLGQTRRGSYPPITKHTCRDPK